MIKPVVLVTAAAASTELRELLQDAGMEVVYMEGVVDEASLLNEFSRRRIAAVILRGPAPFTRTVFASAKDLRVISKYGAGIDSVDLESATAHGVAVMVTNGACARADAGAVTGTAAVRPRAAPGRLERSAPRGAGFQCAHRRHCGIRPDRPAGRPVGERLWSGPGSAIATINSNKVRRAIESPS